MNNLSRTLLFILLGMALSTGVTIAAGQGRSMSFAYVSSEEFTPGPIVTHSENAEAGSGKTDEAGLPVQNEPLAEKPADVVNHNRLTINVVWTLLCAFLVFFMQAGFAMVEAGFTRAKNAGHTMAMNMMVIVFSLLGYWACGYAFQTGGRGFFLSGVYDISVTTLFLSQFVMMNIAVTIPTGAMAERWTFKSFIFYGFFMAMITYPLYAHWVWGGGWLAQLGKNFGLGHGVVDFAGSSVVHMTGGISGLAGAIVLGPRMGKYRTNGTPVAIPGHHIPMAIIGCLILFFGWFGFNAGSTAAIGDLRIGVIAVNTMLASAAAAMSAMCYMWIKYGKPDISLSVNGLLGGLVAISGPSAYVGPTGAVIIGLIAGMLCCASVFFVERKLKVDDPVGAISVHGACGAWGMISIGLFADGTYGDGLNGVPGAIKGLFYGGASQFIAEAIGLLVNVLFVFVLMYTFFKLVDKIIPLRVSEEVEFEGLDHNEVSVTAYPDFSIMKARR